MFSWELVHVEPVEPVGASVLCCAGRVVVVLAVLDFPSPPHANVTTATAETTASQIPLANGALVTP